MEKKSKSSQSPSRRHGSRPQRERFLRRVNGTGSIPGTDCRMNGFNYVCRLRAQQRSPLSDPSPAVRVRSAKGPLRTSLWPSSTFSSIRCMRRTWTAVSFLINTSSRARREVRKLSAQRVGLRWRLQRYVPTMGSNRQIPDGYEEACFANTSLGEEADNAGVRWAYDTGAIGHDGQIYSAYQANKYVYYGSDWKNDIITPQTQFLSDVSNGSSVKSPGSRPFTRTPTILTPARTRVPCGGFPRQCHRSIAVLGQHGDLHILGRLRGWYHPEPPAYVDYDGLGVRSQCSSFRHMQRKGTSRTSIRARQHPEVVEDLFGLPRLAASDKRAKSPEKDALNFNQSPRQIKVIPSVLGKDYFMRHPLDLRPPDND